MKKKTVTTCFFTNIGHPLITWNLHESIRTKKLFWDQKFSSIKMRNSFVRLPILDWIELPSEIKIKQDKKVSPGNIELSSAQLTK